MINKELVKAFVQECKNMQEWEARFKADHIDWTDFLKYSGKTEEFNKEYKQLMDEFNKPSLIKAIKLPKKSRKEYFKQYWLANK